MTARYVLRAEILAARLIAEMSALADRSIDDDDEWSKEHERIMSSALGRRWRGILDRADAMMDAIRNQDPPYRESCLTCGHTHVCEDPEEDEGEGWFSAAEQKNPILLAALIYEWADGPWGVHAGEI